MMKKILFFMQVLGLLFLPLDSMAIDATSFNPVPILVEAKANSGVPIGTVIAWPSHTSPPDADAWLDCKGQIISRSIYPDLYAIVGSRLPNYQGMFLRGYGRQTSSHYGYVSHSSGNLGQVQGDAIRNIEGSFYAIDPHSRTATGSFKNDPWSLWNGTSDNWRYVIDQTIIHFKASNVVPTDMENRPVNMAVRYLIRAK